MMEAVSRNKEANKAMCLSSSKANKRRYESMKNKANRTVSKAMREKAEETLTELLNSSN